MISLHQVSCSHLHHYNNACGLATKKDFVHTSVGPSALRKSTSQKVGKLALKIPSVNAYAMGGGRGGRVRCVWRLDPCARPSATIL